MKDKVNDIKDWFERFMTEHFANCFVTKFLGLGYKGFKRVAKVTLSYLDFITDSILLFSTMTVLGETWWRDPTQFPSQVAILLLVSIFVPLLISALSIAYSRPFILLEPREWKKMTLQVCPYLYCTHFNHQIYSPNLPVQYTLDLRKILGVDKKFLRSRYFLFQT